ncbi:nitrate reductase molybdenum cofactor assembly chaperone [Acidimangrovimonas pyrenivorans]|uniref:Nitrate reductase molybdenum cofactor assembly chaperone n=1 Tax=Acidimangrovimonas pyrenivorans TaxID=2030798 RepID=A0ABV7AKJ3_9RHOB
MDKTLKTLSLLLSYPTEELQQALPELCTVLTRDGRLTDILRRHLRPLLHELEVGDIYALQARYVDLFDRSRSLSLNLFEHVHGESRDRGGAMVSLLETYRAGGFEPATTELPDHLPVLLEYLSLRPEEEVTEILADAAHILAALEARLVMRESAYSAVFSLVLHLVGARADAGAVAHLLERPEDDPDDLEQLDALWEETEVTFGPDPNAGCPQVRDMLARMDTPQTRPARTAAE